MRNRQILLAILVLLAVAVAIPCSAQGVGKSCDISGTWYGGSDPAFQYLWTITPLNAGRYSSVTQPGFDNRPFGYITWTNWTGEITRVDARTYDSYGMSYWVWAPGAAPDGVNAALPEVDIVHSRLRLVDCNTMTSTIDLYAGYFSFTPEKTPFVTPPDVDWLQVLYPGVTTLMETYHRMPTTLRFSTAGGTRPQPAAAAAGPGAGSASKSPAAPTAAPGEPEVRR